MTSMRPFQIIVLAVFIVLALGGLLAFAMFKGFGGIKPVGPVTIWGTFPQSAVQGAIDDVKRNHEEFNLIAYEEHDAATFDTDLAEAIAAGNGPDLIITTQERILNEANKLNTIPFSSIPERTFRDMYVPIAFSFLTPTGTYAIPIAVDPLVLYYNRTRLTSAGVVQVPSTWEAVIGVTPRLTTKTNVGYVEKPAIALGTYDNIGNARAIISLLLLQSGTSITTETQAGRRSTLAAGGSNNSGGSSADSAISFYTQFADPAKIVYTWSRSIPDARQSFVTGDSALYIGFASERPLLMASNPNLDFDMTVIPQAQTSSSRTNYGIVYGFAIPKASKNPTGAYQLAQALTTKTSIALLLEKLPLAPAAKNLLAAPPNDPYAPIVYGQALIAKAWMSPAPGVTDRIFAAMITSVISGSATVHDAVTTADQSLNAAL